MELNALKNGDAWMTSREKELCKEFANGMRKVFRRRGVLETPLLTMRMNATISTYLHARRLEAHLIGDPTIEKDDAKPENQPDEQVNDRTRTEDETERHGTDPTSASDQASDPQSPAQSDAAGEVTPAPMPNTDPHARSRTIALLESIGKAWDRNGRAIRELETHCEKAGTPITMGIADEMKPTILRAAGVIEESIRFQKQLDEAEEASEPPQNGIETGQKVQISDNFFPGI